MKHLLLPLLLLGTVSALHLKNDARCPDAGETQADLQGSGEQEGELALAKEVIQLEGEEVKASRSQTDCDEEEAVESNSKALEEGFQCPREEDTVQMPGRPGCKTCRYLLVRTPRTFSSAQNVCRRCYRGNLVSIHSTTFNYQMQCLTTGLNSGQVWIGGTINGWLWCQRLHWTDGSSWNFGYWAPGQPGPTGGHCVSLCTRGGHWRRTSCRRPLPFICSY